MNWKQNLAVMLATIMLLGCPEPKEEESVVQKPIELPDGKTGCACTETKHLGIGEICPCGADNCACELKVYGSITDNAGNVIPIYRNGKISDKVVLASANDIIAGYNGMSNDLKDKLVGKIPIIYFGGVKHGSYSYFTNVLCVNEFSAKYIYVLFEYIANDNMVPDGPMIQIAEKSNKLEKTKNQFLVNLRATFRKKHRIA